MVLIAKARLEGKLELVSLEWHLLALPALLGLGLAMLTPLPVPEELGLGHKEVTSLPALARPDLDLGFRMRDS